ncbi:GGDEF domain-containing protein [Pseudooceanicola onchidii]|uniref:GGDEF domain-containing protein n=1 Tax=Pseudooceanicola onchidii TaxID=2562279 RepID=UPI0010AA2A53|nr:GGDEF domain-containing protein [Pseudooceanicola onchidii]
MTRLLPDDGAGGGALCSALDQLCPMHCILDPQGMILHAGPTLQKLRPGLSLPGQTLWQVFDIVQPCAATSMAALTSAAGRRTRLRLRFRDLPRTDLQGLLVPQADGGAIVNLAFGISILDAVRDYALTNTDFAATDPTVEMLFLVEAKSAAMEASRKLTRQLHVAKIAAEEQAFTDTLTGLKNRRALDHVLGRMIGAGREFALMHLDLDFFKQVNDTLGHAAGDHVLEHVAAIMVEETRNDDVVARVGGDEFVLVFHSLCDRARLSEIAHRLIARLEEPIRWKDETCRISASVGTAISTDYADPEAERMIADADTALYAAKRGGRAQHRFFEPVAPPAGSRVTAPEAKMPPEQAERRKR